MPGQVLIVKHFGVFKSKGSPKIAGAEVQGDDGWNTFQECCSEHGRALYTSTVIPEVCIMRLCGDV